MKHLLVLITLLIVSPTITCTTTSCTGEDANTCEDPMLAKVKQLDNEPGFEYFTVTVGQGKLGVQFEKSPKYVKAVEIFGGGLVAKMKPRLISVGDELVNVNGKSLAGLDLMSSVNALIEADNPRTLAVRRRAKTDPAPKRKHRKTTRNGKQPHRPTESRFDVVFPKKGPLGMMLLDDLSIKELVPTGAAAEIAGDVLKAGDKIAAVNGKPMKNMDLSTVIDYIAKIPSPRTITFIAKDGGKRQSVGTNTPNIPVAQKTESADMAENLSVSIVLAEPSILAGESYSAALALFGRESYTPHDCHTVPLVTGVEKGRKTLSIGCKAFSKDIAGKLVLVKRGSCSFVTKARNVQKGNGAGMVVVNDQKKGVIEMPFASHELAPGPVPFPAVMVSLQDGMALQGLLGTGVVKVKLGLEESCRNKTDLVGSSAEAVDWSVETVRGRERPRRNVPSTITWTVWRGTETGSETDDLFGMHALFGPVPGGATKPAGVELADGDGMACSPLKMDMSGKFVVAHRGKCSFAQKALNIQQAHGAGLVVVNNEPGVENLYEMPADPDEESMIKISAIMITPSAWSKIASAFAEPTADVNGNTAKVQVISRLFIGKHFWCDLRKKLICGVDNNSD